MPSITRVGDIDVELAGGVIVEKEQGFRPLDDDVVDAHGDEVDADGVMPAGFDGELELGADPIRAGDEHGLAVAVQGQLEQGAEPSQSREHAGPRGAGNGRFDPLDEAVAGIDIDAGILITQ